MRMFGVLFLIFAAVMATAQNTFHITANDKTVIATFADSEAAAELMTLLETGPLTVRMSDYGGFEKVGSLPQSLKQSDVQITTAPGDIMLYRGRDIVMFYGSNTWAYTPLAKIDGATASGMSDFLAGDEVDVTFTLDLPLSIDNAEADYIRPVAVYNLQGIRIETESESLSSLAPGIYIVDGVKRVVR